MKKKIFKNTILCALLCICLAVLMACAGNPSGETPDDGKKNETATMVEVVRFTAAMKKGDKITEDKVKLEQVREDVIPLNALKTTEGIIGKYLTADVVAGDYVFPNKLSSTAEAEKEFEDGIAYISVKASITEGKDNTAEIQKLIDENPGRTLYFADGTYNISKPLVLSAGDDKKVSFELSDYAVIKAASTWNADEAMIRIGGKNGSAASIASATIKGGVVDGNGKAKGISVESGRDSVITNVSVKNTSVGIILGSFSGTDARTTVENTMIFGNGKSGSVGISVTSNANLIEIVEINNCDTGVSLTGKDNLLRNVHAVYSGSAVTSKGFDDNGETNSYDFCYSENYAIGFYMGSNVKGSTYTVCYAFWRNGIATQTAFESAGKFTSNVRTCQADFNDSAATSAYLKVGAAGGNGQVLWPMIKNKGNIDNTAYQSYLAGTSVTDAK